jgi:hypothetical protein
MASEVSGGDLSVSFELTLDDLVAGYKHTTGSEHRLGVWGLLVAILMSTVMAVGGFWLGSPGMLGIGTLGAVIMLALLLTPVRGHVRHVCRANPYVLGGRVVRIDGNGLVIESEHVSVVYGWHVIKSVENTAQYAFFRLPAYDGLPISIPLPLPRRAFPDDAAFGAFLSEIRRRATEFQQSPREVR